LKKNKISKNWIIKQHRDPFFKESKIQGYRSRSAFKLLEMNNKFKFINKNTNLIDLGSSPGGWSQVVAKTITKGKILSIDIKPMKKIDRVSYLQEDINNHSIYDKIYKYFGTKVDVVLSDMAANTSGNKDLDSNNTGELCLIAMDLSLKILKKDGTFLSKIFMGSVFQEINKKANKYFKKVVKFKPISSRSNSKEIYIYCKGI
jgi:23S rRNA (uridine2552-2'-O)-methyltransferase